MEAQVSALEIQVAESREIVQGMGWKLIEQYVESESATTRNRPLYQKMLSDIEAHRFDILVIKSIDRINRNVRDFYFLLDCLAQNQVKLYLYLEHKYYEAGDSLITGIKAILAEDFSRELSRKIRNAHERRQKLQTGLNISRVMFGWNKIGKNQFELNKEEAEYYRQGFDLAREGNGYRSIAKIMYERGARSREGNGLTEVQWRNMLRSPRAHGEMILHKNCYNFETKKREQLPPEEWIHVKEALPEIISEEAHKEILAILDVRAQEVNEKNQFRRGQGEKGKGLFSNKLECACCGKHYYRVTDRSAMGKMPVWKCASYINYGKKSHNYAGCDNVVVREKVLKQLILDKCQKLFDAFCMDDDSIIHTMLEVLQQALEINDISDQEKIMQARQKKLLQRKDRLLDKLMDGTISDVDFKRTNQMIQGELDSIQKNLHQIEKTQGKCHPDGNRLVEIKQKILQEKIVHEVKANYLLEKIERMKVYPDGKIHIFLKRSTLFEVTNVLDISGFKEEREQLNFEVQYCHVTLSEERRTCQKEQIVRIMEENPHITIPEIAKQLGFAYSYVNQRIKELKGEGKIYYDRKKGQKCWKLN